MSEVEMMSTAGGATRRPLRRAMVLLAMCIVIVLVLAVAAVAFFTASGSGSGAAVVGSISPATISAPATSGTPVTITWIEQATITTASLDNDITYTVLRKQGAGSFAPVGSGTCAGTLVDGTTSCADTTGTSSGTYSYEVIANLGSFSAVSNAVSVSLAVTPPTDSVALVAPLGAYLSAAIGTVYVNSTSGGSFGLADTVQATGSAPASATFPAVAGNGWSGHTASETVRTGTGSSPATTYSSSARYSFGAGAVATSGIVSSTDNLGNVSSGVDLKFLPVRGPTDGTLTVDGTTGTSIGSSVLTSARSYPLSWTAFTADDSGVASSSLSVKFAPWSSDACGTYGSPATLTSTSPATQTESSGDGCYQYTLAQTDNVGLTATLTVTVEVDATAPVTTDDSASIGGWQNRALTVTLQPTDAGSGVANTYFTTDGTTPAEVGGVPQGTTQMGTSVVLATSGTFSIKYFSVDEAGNSEVVKTAASAIRIDLVAPGVPAPIVNGHT
jgi:hypothetical protein